MSGLADRLQRALADLAARGDAAAMLARLVDLRLDRLPQPGAGQTLARWQALAVVAAHDLSLAKLYEGHTDALAIMEELDEPPESAPGSIWAVWAAEAPGGRAVIEPMPAGRQTGDVILRGGKCWCSGVSAASDALLTAWHADGRGPQLVRLPLRQAGVAISAAAWRAVGMAGSASLEVRFDGAKGRRVGASGAYLARPGFWQGGAGVAACWYGGSLAIAAALHRAVAGAPAAASSPWRLAALGKVDLALRSTAALLREAAAWIDAHPVDDASEVALRVRLAAEDSARSVLDEVGRALGAGPFCHDPHIARMAADLPVFVRQSHAERDFAALAERVVRGAPATASTAPRRDHESAADPARHGGAAWTL